MWNSPLYGNYRNLKFTGVWESVEDFLSDYEDSPIKINGNSPISEESASTLFYLLYARYGNSTIASYDINQFKFKVFMLIFQYGPTWQKRLDIQEKLRNMSEEDLRESAKAIYNHSYNPSTDPSTDTLDELLTINDQNVTKHKRSRTDAYALLLSLLETDVTGEFLDRFKNLFLKVVAPEKPLWYITDLDIEGEEDNDA